MELVPDARRLRDYYLARGLRILPGLWTCLIVTAFVIAPTAVAIQGGSAAKLLLSRRAVRVRPWKQCRTATQPRCRRNTARGPLVWGVERFRSGPCFGNCCATSLLLVSAWWGYYVADGLFPRC